ncbi:hypothetical protein QOT17_016009 [Balamuthia mandrillaris]
MYKLDIMVKGLPDDAGLFWKIGSYLSEGVQHAVELRRAGNVDSTLLEILSGCGGHVTEHWHSGQSVHVEAETKEETELAKLLKQLFLERDRADKAEQHIQLNIEKENVDLKRARIARELELQGMESEKQLSLERMALKAERTTQKKELKMKVMKMEKRRTGANEVGAEENGYRKEVQRNRIFFVREEDGFGRREASL